MNEETTPRISWILCSIAVLAWTLVGFFSWEILQMENNRVTSGQKSAQLSAKQISAARIHSFLAETRDQRARLEVMMHMDIAEIIDAIDQVGDIAGVPVQISNTLPQSGQNGSSLLFIVQGQGTFAQVTHLAELFETLPIPSTVQELGFNRMPGTGAPVWQLSVRIKVLTNGNPTTL